MHPIPDELQLIILIGVPLFFCVIERIIPALSNRNTLHRWPVNFGLGLLNALIFSSISVLAPISVAIFCSSNNLGIFNLWPIDLFYEIIFVLLIKTFMQYIFHIAMHKYEILWQIHKIHHSDKFLDASSCYRFHPFEVILSRLILVPVILITGFSALSITIVETLQIVGSIATHSNFRLHPKLEKIIRFLFITPTLHRYHHSKNIVESNRNFGDLLVIWDKLFKTLHIPADGNTSPAEYGVDGIQQSSLIDLVEMPFKK